MFRDEMSAQARPSLDRLAQEVLVKGRRARRARTAKLASAVLAAAGVIGAAVVVPSMAGGHSAAAGPGPAAKPATSAWRDTRAAPTGGPNTVPAAVILTSAKSSASYIPQPPGPKAPTSNAAILDELLKLLPHGATSNYAFYGLGAQTYLDGAAGPGMIRIFLFKGSLNPDACTSAVPSDMTQTCSTLPSGARVLITKISDNCVEPLAVDVDHGDGTVVQVDVARCLAWNGHSNPPTHMAITAAQALRIAANPAWGAGQMDAAVVHQAASRFANVPGGS